MPDINKPPIANAGPDVVVHLPNRAAELDGSSSYDDHGIVEYEWSRDPKSPAAGVGQTMETKIYCNYMYKILCLGEGCQLVFLVTFSRIVFVSCVLYYCHLRKSLLIFVGGGLEMS